MKKVNIYIGPVRYKNWFKYDDRKFVIDVSQNILFYIFPFLIYVIPLECYEVKSDEKFIKGGIKTVKNTTGIIAISITGAATDVISRALTINISVLPIIPISIGIITAIAMRVILKVNTPGKIIRKYKVRILPNNLFEELFKIFMYFCSVGAMFALIYILFQEPNNLFWFLGLIPVTFFVLSFYQIVLNGRMKVKFIKVLKCEKEN